MKVRVSWSFVFYTTHSLSIDVFGASKSDIVQLRSLVPHDVPQLLLADATATKVGPRCFEWTLTMLNLSI